MTSKLTILAILLLSSFKASANNPTPVGKWDCPSYEITHDLFTATGAEVLVLFENGEYEEIETASYLFSGTNEQLSVVTERTGLWSYQEDVIAFTKKTAKVISSSNPKLPVAVMQQFENETLLNAPTTKFQILTLDDTMTFRIIDDTAPKEVTDQTYVCTRV